MRILLAPDKFKGTFTAAEVCARLAAGIAAADPSATVVPLPLADGGEGTLDILLEALGGERFEVNAPGPLGEMHAAELGRLPDGTAIVESAKFCGLSLVPEGRRNPMAAGTYGLGIALRAALSGAPREILVGLGGSATVDGGLGVARAMGYRLADAAGGALDGRACDLLSLERIEPPETPTVPAATRVRVLCDVLNPLTGARGAAALFGPQKGASPEQVRDLERGLSRLASIAARDLGRDVTRLAGGGAAGGLGAGLCLFAAGEIEPGAEAIARLTGLDAALEGADLVVTGEGRVDAGTLEGKVVAQVLARARDRAVPAIVVCGAWEGERWQGVKILSAGGLMSAQDLENAGKTLVFQGFSRDQS